MTPEPDIAAVPWYTSEEIYEAFRSAAEDAHVFFETYDVWRRVALDHELRAARNGVTIFRTCMFPGEFLAWCNRRGLANDSASRSAFAMERAQRMIDPGG